MLKRHISNPSLAILTDEQRGISKEIDDFVESSDKLACLTGFAGTGKTFLTSFCVERLLTRYPEAKVCASALTNKARLVLFQKADFQDERLVYSTIHSLLAIRPHVDSYGNEKFKPDNKSKPSLTDYDFVFVDEASMLDNFLFSMIFRLIADEYSTTKVVFIGDPFQLNPINHLAAIPMQEKDREKFKIKHFSLQTIVRQAQENPIIAFSKELREMRYNPRTQKDENGGGLFVTPRSMWDKALTSFFCSEKYDNNPDYCKVIGWTNKTVGKFNRRIRELKYGKDAPYLIPGERLIADKPIMDFTDESTIIFNTNEELVINEFEEQTTIVRGQKYKVYEAMAHSPISQVSGNITLIHPDSRALFNAEHEKLKKLALEEKQGTKEANICWVKYFNFEKKFARCNRSFAITAHKSQGSTLENAIVLPMDILSNRKKPEAFRCLYTAVTRSTKKTLLFS